MEACNELVLVMRNCAETSQQESEIESIGLDLKRISEELEIAKRE